MTTDVFFLESAYGGGVSGYDLASTTRGTSSVDGVTSTVSNGTNVLATKTQGGSLLQFITQPLRAPVTIAGLISANLRAVESSSGANCAIGVRIYKRDRSGVETLIVTMQASSEMSTTNAANVFSSVPTSTNFLSGDRIVFKPFITNMGGNMSGGRTVTTSYSGPTPAAAGDAYVSFSENLVFGIPTTAG
jgi:hypothetical protein